MAFVAAGPDTKVILSQYHLSSFFNSVALPSEVSTQDTTGFGKTAHCHTPILRDGTVTLGGFYDAATRVVSGETVSDAVDVALSAAPSTSRLLTVALAGMAAGTPVRVASVLQTSYEISGEVDGVVEVSAEIQTADNGLEAGVSLADLTARTTTANGTAVDNGAATTNGGVAHLHSVLGTGGATGTVVVKVQHSVDNSVWVDLVTFSTLTRTTGSPPTDGSGAERQSVAGTVNRYLRATWTFSASAQLTLAVAFARR